MHDLRSLRTETGARSPEPLRRNNNSFHDREEHKAIIKVGQIALEMLMDEKKADVIESISIGQSAAKIRAGLKGATGALSNRDPYMKNQNIKDAG